MGMGDLEHETQTQLFQTRVLKVNSQIDLNIFMSCTALPGGPSKVGPGWLPVSQELL